MPDPTKDTDKRTGEVPGIPHELSFQFERAAPFAASDDVPDIRSSTGTYRITAETHDDTPQDVDRPIFHKDSPA